MTKPRNNDHPYTSDWLVEALVDDILDTSDHDILEEVREDYGDPYKLANDVTEVIGVSLPEKPSIRMRAAADDGRGPSASTSNASRSKRPKLLASLVSSQGNIEIFDDGKCVYVTSPAMLSGGSLPTLRLEERSYLLHPSQQYAGLFEVQNLASADAEEFVVLHSQNPERYPVTWESHD